MLIIITNSFFTTMMYRWFLDGAWIKGKGKTGLIKYAVFTQNTICSFRTYRPWNLKPDIESVVPLITYTDNSFLVSYNLLVYFLKYELSIS